MEKSRRKFIMNTAAASSATFLSPSIVSSSVFGANDRINCAVVGVRSRGKAHAAAINSQNNSRIIFLLPLNSSIMYLISLT